MAVDGTDLMSLQKPASSKLTSNSKKRFVKFWKTLCDCPDRRNSWSYWTDESYERTDQPELIGPGICLVATLYGVGFTISGEFCGQR